MRLRVSKEDRWRYMLTGSGVFEGDQTTYRSKIEYLEILWEAETKSSRFRNLPVKGERTRKCDCLLDAPAPASSD